MMRYGILVVLASVACHAAPDALSVRGDQTPSLAAGPAESPLRASPRPRPASAVLASYEYGVTGRVPSGGTYCPRSDNDPAPDHARVIYLSPPAACDANGVVLGDSAPSSVSVYYSYNIAEGDYPDGLRTARTATELIAMGGCAHPRRLSGVTLLGLPAIGCWTETTTGIDVYAEAPYDLDRPADWKGPNAHLGVELTTTRARLNADWPVFVQFAADVQLCAAEFRETPGARTFWVGAAPGRRECPPDGFW